MPSPLYVAFPRSKVPPSISQAQKWTYKETGKHLWGSAQGAPQGGREIYEVRSLGTNRKHSKEPFPPIPISSAIDLCGGGWGSWIPLTSPPYPYCLGVWKFQFAAHRCPLWGWSPGKPPTLLTNAVSRDFSQWCSYFLWTRDIILGEIYLPSRIWGHWCWGNGTVHLKLPHRYLSKLESDKWVTVCSLVASRGCQVKPHCVPLSMFGPPHGPTVW